MVATFEKRTIGRVSDYNSHYCIDGKEVRDVIFYNDNGVILSHRGLLTGVAYTDTSYSEVYTVSTINVCQPSRRAKVNLTRQENFYVPNKKEYTWSDSTVDLYLYVDNDNITLDKLDKEIVETRNYGTNGSIYTREVFKLSGDVVWYVKTIADYQQTDIKEIFMVQTKHIENFETELGVEVKKAEQQLKDKGISVDSYDLQKIMRYFSLTERPYDLDKRG